MFGICLSSGEGFLSAPRTISCATVEADAFCASPGMSRKRVLCIELRASLALEMDVEILPVVGRGASV